MREIEFRAYNKAIDKMTNWDFIKRVRNLNKLLTLNHVEVMQYTGLKDKNGKKIFEGDILSDEVEVDGLIEKSKRQVFWNNKKGFWALDYSFDQDKSLSDSLYKELKIFEFEIIGNIHENKELLK